MEIPLEQGFTVVTGPNGSGKSNILDGVLFCLGLASSRGMRADRLPDLVNSSLLRAGKSAETKVSVRFDLTDWQPDQAEEGLERPPDGPWIDSNQKEWTVTRRLRIMPGGSYSSSYASDGEPCTLQQLQTQFRRLRIDPEGSNVVMQGDVTRIVSMSNRDRRGLIDELAGVALFDRRIEQTRTKLDDVQERQERCRIVEQELHSTKQKLERDCSKARTYQDLKSKLHLGRQHELILNYEHTKENLEELRNEQKKLEEKEIKDAEKIEDSNKELAKSSSHLADLQQQVKELGEDKLITVQAEIAGIETQNRELERQASLHKQEGEKLQELRTNLSQRRKELHAELNQNKIDLNSEAIRSAEQQCKDALSEVESSRRRMGDAAGRSGKWLDEQKEINNQRQVLKETISPLKLEEQKLQESLLQRATTKKELELEQSRDINENKELSNQLDQFEKDLGQILNKVNKCKEEIKEVSEELSIQQRTRLRLEQEQTRVEREIARLDSRRETLQESRGTGALKLLLEAGIEGIHGSVAQLGDVEEYLRLALEVAAGSRLSQLVVDDDRIAAKAIELLKIKRAGRLTFLPLNRIRSSTSLINQALAKGTNIKNNEKNHGPIGKAIDLINFDPIYTNVFAYVFGETLVFKDLQSARPYLGKNRAVTLDGELLEKNGAMTGGSFSGRTNRFSFGRTIDKDEAEPLRERLLEIGEALISCKNEENRTKRSLEILQPKLSELEKHQASREAERVASKRSNKPLLERRYERSDRLKSLIKDQQEDQEKLDLLLKKLNPLVLKLEQLERYDKGIEFEGDLESLKRFQNDLESADIKLGEARKNRDKLINEKKQRELFLERLGDQQNTLNLEEENLQNAIKELGLAHIQRRKQQQESLTKRESLEEEQRNLQARFGEQRRARDIAEANLADQRQKIEQAKWNLDRLKQQLEGISEQIRSEVSRLQELGKTLPEPLPKIPEEVRNSGLENLQQQLQDLQRRMEELEPVNMLALEELEQLEIRLTDLVEKLDVLSAERSELLLRIETVATLRQEAFMEAFEAVDKHFQEIFASLSDGDGHLQLDNAEDPLEGGLTLVAHPKGKTVRRLAAMSGGEKSLTALSFLFALQRFRPSPFYALDEVDSFLDGVNVERLASLISSQATEAQFLVVSHRRPMISASSKTIGVTQARGSHTQVIGLPDAA